MGPAVDACGVIHAGERRRFPLSFQGGASAPLPFSVPGKTWPTTLLERLDNGEAFLAASADMLKFRAHVQEIARVDAPVLLLGEGGTGKELIGRLIHKSSRRAAHNFASLRCFGASEEALEAELFGFAGETPDTAPRHRKGLLELCHQGTLFLEQIDELPARLQARLLDVLDQQQVCRAGDRSTVKADVRILASSRGDLQRAMACGKLRQDLYYRLHALVLNVPALRERREEIPALFEHLLNRLARRHRRRVPPLAPELLERCRQHDWPGNFCELENFATRFLLSGGEAQPPVEFLRKPRRAPRELRKHFVDAGNSVPRDSAVALRWRVKSAS